MKNKKSGRRLKSGVYSVAICAVMTLAVVGFNLMISALPASVMKKDVTTEGLYTFSEQTNQILGGLEDNVEMYLIAEPGKEDNYIVNLLARYEQTSEKIRVKRINPLINPTFAAGYTDETPENNDVLVVCGQKSLLVRKADMYSYGFDFTYYTNATVFEGETKLTGAVNTVSSKTSSALLISEGHGEEGLAQRIADTAKNEGFTLKTAVLSPEELKNADAVVIASPTTDISEDEKNMLSEYLDGGGRLLLFSGYSEKSFKNLHALMSSFGLEPLDGVIIEGDGAHSISDYPFYLIPDMQAHAITDPLIASGADVLIPAAMALGETKEHRSTLEVAPLIKTSESAYRKKDPYNTSTFDREQGDETGSFILGAAAQENFAGSSIKVAWYGSDMMSDEQVDALVSGGNTDLIINTLGWLCGRDNSINVRAKSTVSPYLTVTKSFKGVMTVVICAVIPLGALAAGIAIYVRRRRRT